MRTLAERENRLLKSHRHFSAQKGKTATAADTKSLSRITSRQKKGFSSDKFIGEIF